jgi:hypothetical protein
MATKRTTKKTVRKAKTVTPRSLIEQARKLLKKDDGQTTVTELRGLMKETPSEYPVCQPTAKCDFCDAARLVKKADKLRKAA